MAGEIQYVSDTILLEKTFRVLSEFNDGNINKYAFDMGSLLSGIGENIHSFIGSQIHDKDSGGITRTIIDLLAPAVFFGLNPVLGFVVAFAQEAFGFDMYSVYQKIHDAIIPDVEAEKPISADKINNIAKSAIPNTDEEETDEQHADDLLYPLRALEENGQLTKEALGRRSFYSSKDTRFKPLQSLLEVIGKRKGMSFITGIIAWFLKTILLSAGLLIVGGVAAKALGFGVKQQNTTTTQPEQTNTQQPQQNTQQPTQMSIPAPSGAGAYVYKNKPNDIWVENLNGRQPYEMILQWALGSYPSLYQYDNIILNTPSFWNAVRSVTENWRPGQSDIAIPDPYKKRDDVVSLFINDVFRNINQGSA
jgi:hypothetical protein